MKAGILIGHNVVSGDLFFIIQVFAVRSGIDCSDWRNEAHSICRCHFSSTPYLCLWQCCLKINQSGIRAGDRFQPTDSSLLSCSADVESVQEHLQWFQTDIAGFSHQYGADCFLRVRRVPQRTINLNPVCLSVINVCINKSALPCELLNFRPTGSQQHDNQSAICPSPERRRK